MQLSSKQRSLLSYNYNNLYGRMTAEEVEDLLALCDSGKLHPSDISIIIGNLWDMQKDEREGVTEEEKRIKVSEIKKIMETYQTIAG